MIFPFPRRRTIAAAAAVLALAFAASAPPSRAQEEPAAEAKEPAFPGMVDIPGGKVTIGVDRDWFEKAYRKNPFLTGGEKEQWWNLLLVETPAHEKELRPYSIDVYEVTNAQYFQYMEKACRTSVFITDQERSIEQVAEKLYGQHPTDWEQESIFILNRAKLLEKKESVLKENEGIVQGLLEDFNKDLPAQAKVQTFDALPPNWQIRGWIRFHLTKDTALAAYTRVMPETWRAEGKPAADQLKLPVQFISGRDADAFAAWAGKHVPTEEEWEHAARGPEGFLYPWGNEWNCEKQRNLILWRQTKSPPAPPTMDGPIVVDALPESRSPFGCYHMLGNLMEWTSSTPVAWPGSESKWIHYGERGLRVLRGGAYGDGKEYGPQELLFRNTARIIHGYGHGFHEGDRYQAFGFRCAKYSLPAFENMSVAARALAAKRILPPGLVFGPAGSFGSELLNYDPKAPDFAFVRDAARYVGLTPVDRLPYPTAKHLLEAAARAAEGKGDPVPLALLSFSPDLRLSALKVVEPEKPAETAEPGTGESPDGSAPPPAEAPPPKGKAPKGKEKAPPKGKAPKGGKAAPPPPEPEVPAGPVEVKQAVLMGEDPWVICLKGNRLALYRVGIQNLHFEYWLFGPEGETAATEKPLADKVDGKSFPRKAVFEGGTGMFRAQIPFPTSSETSRDVFAVRLALHFSDAPGGAWRNVSDE